MSENASGHVMPTTNNPMTTIDFSDKNIKTTSYEVLNLPSPHITPEDMLFLYREILRLSPDYDGIVLTHGTDTLEETAYFLDTMELPEIPLVLTGAMRSSDQLGSDGVHNYLTALRVAADPQSRGKGVLVVMNDEIHAAKYVTKTHTTNLSTFQTPTHGPIGLITKQNILYVSQPQARQRFKLQTITGTIPIIQAYTGMGSTLLSLLHSEQMSGLVIEAMGAGNVPPQAAEEIKKLIQAGLPVVLVSRCFNGIAEPVYAYEGGGAQLKDMGVMFVKELNAPKARLKLLIALNAGLEGKTLKDYIEG
ncbi:L-asparaginase [Streptococcus moroccensis]|uniref:L-asparaginase n=2 Tax=Streptococcus moroccensis TaxID=1451356 RepID=A0ABT9YS04_9STRE|nr:L-asparaginase [Streptococcus moroccensis]